MITEKEFLQAVDTVKKYQEQINKLATFKPLFTRNPNETIDQWLERHKYPSIHNKRSTVYVRMFNVLKFWTSVYNGEDRIIYMHEITKKGFLNNRNAGKKSWDLFVELTKDEYDWDFET